MEFAESMHWVTAKHRTAPVPPVPVGPRQHLENSNGSDPLGNIQTTMEHHHFYWENQLQMAIFNSYVKFKGWTVWMKNGKIIGKSLESRGQKTMSCLPPMAGNVYIHVYTTYKNGDDCGMVLPTLYRLLGWCRNIQPISASLENYVFNECNKHIQASCSMILGCFNISGNFWKTVSHLFWELKVDKDCT